jgi:hypothetical protein
MTRFPFMAAGNRWPSSNFSHIAAEMIAQFFEPTDAAPS